MTGTGARAIVQLADGSALKFGENASVGVNAMAPVPAVCSPPPWMSPRCVSPDDRYLSQVPDARAINVRTATDDRYPRHRCLGAGE